MEKEDKIADVLAAVREAIIPLTFGKYTGKVELTLEVNLTQGGIGDTFLHTHAREKIAKCKT